jgi:hypothetical protein
MAIRYYPDHVQKKRNHVVDVLSSESGEHSVNGGQDLSGSALAVRFSPLKPSWVVSLVTLHFSAAVSKTYAVSVETGRGIITGLNDSLWIDVNSSGWAQRIVIPQGFYNGSELSTAVQGALDSNSVFSDLGITFTVSYNSGDDTFYITPSSGTIQYYDVYTPQNLRRNSTAGHVLGFTADQSGAFIQSDTVVPSLGVKTLMVGKTGTSDTDLIITDPVNLTIDEALTIDVGGSVSSDVEYGIHYRITEE